ncbi:MAG: bifunctional 2-dehydro-3-deoxy-phosphogluconate/2-dehydro-3-deoxy-6-phosphogalactonate aldolase [Thermoproteus sp.]
MEIVAPVVTPFRGNKIDLDAYAEHIRRIMSKGVDKIFVAGTTGLGPALSVEERKALLEAAASVTKRIIFQVGSLNLEDVISLAKYAERFDIEAVASVAPYYFPRISERQIVRYFKDLCAATSLPVYLYNYPAAVGKDVGAATAKEIGCIRGVKDTIEDIAHTLAYKRLLGDVKAYNGSDSLVLASFAVGLDGAVAASANYLPEVLSQIREALKAGMLERARSLQFLIHEVLEAARPFGYSSAVYELVEIFQGYNVGGPRPPIYPLDPEEKRRLAEAVSRVKEALRS